MPAQGVHAITYQFELELAKYTGAPFAVAVDNCCNAIGLCLELIQPISHPPLRVIELPSHTYPGVASEVIRSGLAISFYKTDSFITGKYKLLPTNIWDSALEFNGDMYIPGALMCLSFTGPFKRLKLSKGGAILLDDKNHYEWFKRARNSGRGECSYHEDTFTMNGRNCYMLPEIAARGLHMMSQFYDNNGHKIYADPLTMPYPDLSNPKHTAYRPRLKQ